MNVFPEQILPPGAEIAGTTFIRTTAGGDIRLRNANNDFNLVTIETDYNDYVAITDRNDLVLGDIHMNDSSLRLESLGTGATISQAAGSKLYLSAGTLQISADNVILGEADATSQLSAVNLRIDFGNSIATNDSISLLPYSGFYANTARIRAMDREYGDVYLDLRGDRDIDLNADIDMNNLRLTLHGMTGSNAAIVHSRPVRPSSPAHASRVNPASHANRARTASRACCRPRAGGRRRHRVRRATARRGVSRSAYDPVSPSGRA